MSEEAQSRDGLRARLAGITPVVVSPFHNDQIHYPALEAEVRWLLEHGARSLAIGLASEVTFLTHGERLTLITSVRRLLPPGALLVAACSADSTRAVVELGTQLTDAGADALMVTPPRTPGLDSEAVVRFYRRLGAISSALIVQDAPQETGVHIDDETLRRLVAEVEGVVAVKLESADALDRMSRLADPLHENGVLMLGGSGGADYLLELDMGAGGTMPGPALVDVFLRMDYLHRSGERAAAARLMTEYADPIEVARRGMAPFIAAQKRFLRARGLEIPLEIRDGTPTLPTWLTDHIETLTAALPRTAATAPARGH